MKNTVQAESLDMMKKMLKQLRTSPNALVQQMQLALTRGNFSQAAAMLNQLQKDLTTNKLTELQKKELAEQLQNLSKQLAELAGKNEELEKELEKLGLDKKLARLDEKQLRQNLQKQGISEEKIEELLRKAAVSQMARSRCSSLAGAMAACGGGAGGLDADGLAMAMEQLDQLEALQQQLMLTEASLAEIANAIGGLGEGMGQGLGSQGQYNTIGAGGGHGDGIGISPGSLYTIEELEKSNTIKTHAKSKMEDGPIIASWYFHDSQVKGEAKRNFTEVIQAGRDTAAEAISENEIPRKYEDAIKQYFGGLEQPDNK
jgi:regulator of replication initiation timing